MVNVWIGNKFSNRTVSIHKMLIEWKISCNLAPNETEIMRERVTFQLDTLINFSQNQKQDFHVGWTDKPNSIQKRLIKLEFRTHWDKIVRQNLNNYIQCRYHFKLKLTISIFTISWFHLNRMMHLKKRITFFLFTLDFICLDIDLCTMFCILVLCFVLCFFFYLSILWV